MLAIVGGLVVVQLVVLTVTIERLSAEVRALRNEKRRQAPSDCRRCVTSR